VGEERLDALRMVQPAADAAAVGRADDHWAVPVAAGAVVDQRRLVHDLVEGGEDVVRELDLADRVHPGHRRADPDRDDAQLGQRGVDHTVRAVLIKQADGRAEDAAARADVLAGDEDAIVALHLLVHRLAQSFDEGNFGHSGRGSSSKSAGRPRGTHPASSSGLNSGKRASSAGG